MLFIGGVYAEDISCDVSETQVCEIQNDISSSDIVSSNYLTDSEVSDAAPVSEECYEDTEEASSTINVDKMSQDYCISSDLDNQIATNPAIDVGNSKEVSIDYSVDSDLEEIEQVTGPALEVGNNKFMSVDCIIDPNLEGCSIVDSTVAVGDFEFLSLDCSDSINQYSISEVKSIDASDELDISISAQNCVIQENEIQNSGLIEYVLADVSSSKETSENSKLGRYVTTREYVIFKFESVGTVFVITTADVLKLIEASETAVEGVFDNARYISHDNDVLTLHEILNDAKEVYLGVISGSILYPDGKDVLNAFEAENVFISLADGIKSISLDVLQEADFQSQCEKTNSGYTITKELLQYYPPANKGNIIVMERDSNLLGSYSEDEQYLKISNSNYGIDLCNPLWFNFILKQSDGSLMSIYMRHNEDNLFIDDYNGTQTYNLISRLYNSTLSSGMSEGAYGIDEAIADNQCPNQSLGAYATSESKDADLSYDLYGLEEISGIKYLRSLEDINNEDLLKSVATNIDNAKNNTKSNINANNNCKFKSCKCANCNHLKCNCLNCNCSKMNCNKLNNTKCHCNCSHHSHEKGRKHTWGHYPGHDGYNGYEYVGDIIDKIGSSYGMLADNSTDNSTNKNATVAKGPFNIPKPIEPTNFNTLIISLAGILVLSVLFGISHRRQQN